MRQIVIFGASGNLACKKLFPKLFELGYLDIQIIAYARSPLKNTFKQRLCSFYNKYTDEFLDCIKYIEGSYDNLIELSTLTTNNTILYFAVPPSVYLNLLKEVRKVPHSVVALEKPYGVSIDDFKNIQKLKLKNLLYVDHYLTKPSCSTFPVIKNQNNRFYEFLSNKNVVSTEINFFEDIDAEGRKFFDKNGIIKDLMQTHLTQVLAQFLHSPDSNRSNLISEININYEKSIFGQYEGYEKEMRQATSTETFASIPFTINEKKMERCEFFNDCWKSISKQECASFFSDKKLSF